MNFSLLVNVLLAQIFLLENTFWGWTSLEGEFVDKIEILSTPLTAVWKISSRVQGRPKAPPATQNASQKSLGDKNKEVKGDKIYLFVSRENKCIKPIKQ